MNRDSIGYKGSEWNLYGYCNSAPISCLDPTGDNYIVDTAGETCCEGEACELGIAVTVPKRSVKQQVADRLLGRGGDLDSGHTWILGHCGNRHIEHGVRPTTGWFGGPARVVHDWEWWKSRTHEELMKVCGNTWKCVFDAVQDYYKACRGPNPPRYDLFPGVGTGNSNCTTFVYDVFKNCNIKMEYVVEPADLPGTRPEMHPVE